MLTMVNCSCPVTIPRYYSITDYILYAALPFL